MNGILNIEISVTVMSLQQRRYIPLLWVEVTINLCQGNTGYYIYVARHRSTFSFKNKCLVQYAKFMIYLSSDCLHILTSCQPFFSQDTERLNILFSIDWSSTITAPFWRTFENFSTALLYIILTFLQPRGFQTSFCSHFWPVPILFGPLSCPFTES